jgi:hypothetical protein
VVFGNGLDRCTGYIINHGCGNTQYTAARASVTGEYTPTGIWRQRVAWERHLPSTRWPPPYWDIEYTPDHPRRQVTPRVTGPKGAEASPVEYAPGC